VSNQGSRSADPAAGSGRLVARNRTRDTVLATDVESADGLWAKFLGLMGRPGLAAGAGLWLPESNGIHMMFMRFPIDVVFLGRLDVDGRRTVLATRESLPAWRGLVPLVRGAHGVLELPVGTIVATRTIVGDVVSLDAG
jgi:uncharacterized membrane protein (UPF0127 family)